MAKDKVVFSFGSWVFISDPDDMYLPAKVEEAFEQGKPGKVSRDGHVITLTPQETALCIRMDEQSNTSVANLVELKELNEASILHALRLRFKQDQIYTVVGTILVSVNPFKLLPLYTGEVLEGYKQRGARDSAPHVYGTADNAYKAMVADGKNQSCIVSGESGAGKTEATKIFLQYIADISGSSKSSQDGEKKGEGFGTATLQEQILKANPLMEAFGNAKTKRNNNSSRFGKWIEVKFNSSVGNIIGGSITQYLLEKSRLVSQAEGERNYHIFYQLW
jgi:myosin heavy subunit